jgi:hypothetical protein
LQALGQAPAATRWYAAPRQGKRKLALRLFQTINQRRLAGDGEGQRVRFLYRKIAGNLGRAIGNLALNGWFRERFSVQLYLDRLAGAGLSGDNVIITAAMPPGSGWARASTISASPNGTPPIVNTRGAVAAISRGANRTSRRNIHAA